MRCTYEKQQSIFGTGHGWQLEGLCGIGRGAGFVFSLHVVAIRQPLDSLKKHPQALKLIRSLDRYEHSDRV